MTDEKLKPCPFCGGAANLHEGGSIWQAVGCNDKEVCPIQPKVMRTSAAEAIAAWNNRAEPNTLPSWAVPLSTFTAPLSVFGGMTALQFCAKLGTDGPEAVIGTLRRMGYVDVELEILPTALSQNRDNAVLSRKQDNQELCAHKRSRWTTGNGELRCVDCGAICPPEHLNVIAAP